MKKKKKAELNAQAALSASSAATKKKWMITLSLLCGAILIVIAYQMTAPEPAYTGISTAVKSPDTSESQPVAIEIQAPIEAESHVDLGVNTFKSMEQQVAYHELEIKEAPAVVVEVPQVIPAPIEEVPAAVVEAPAVEKRTHVVMSGETLSSISMKYYGTTKKAKDIFEANKNKLTNKDHIKVGMVLVIP